MHLPNLFVFNNYGWGADSSVKISENDLVTHNQTKINSFVDELKQKFVKTKTSKHKYKRIFNYFNFKGGQSNISFALFKHQEIMLLKTFKY